MKSNPVVHFEMPAKDNKRVSDFYSKVFGWQMQQMGPEMGNYVLASTCEVDGATQRPKEPGAINGGFFEYKEDELNRSPHVVIAVDDIEESRKAVEESGGKIIGEKMNIPSVGLYYTFKDTEDNIVGMLQPS